MIETAYNTQIKGDENMNYKTLEERQTNVAEVVGTISKLPTVTHEIEGERFLDFEVEVERLSKAKDIIPVTISERSMGTKEFKLGDRVLLFGQYRSHNKNVDDRNKLILHFFAKDIEKTDEQDKNDVKLTGFICKPPVYRTTPFNREICDILLAVNRPNNHRSDYIPCILWGRNARFIADQSVGTKIETKGRIQSRIYTKKLENGEVEERTAFEVSCDFVAIVEKSKHQEDLGKEII